MDFSKAFDKVDHQRLLLKLHRLGINTGVMAWIQSLLDPCLFLMYINDMPENIQSNIRLFADDTIMYLTISNKSDCQDLQRDLSKLETWEREWLMAFNPDKCEVIRITKKKNPIIFDYKLHGITLQSTKNT